MLTKIKMSMMCTMVLCVVLVHICRSDSSPANLAVIPLGMTLNMIHG